MDPLVVRGCDNAKGKADPSIAAYLDSVRGVQQQYVELLAAAPDHVPAESRSLLAMCAALSRVARLVLDAQRALLDREVAVEVELRECSTSDSGADADRLDDDESSVRQAVASLGRQVVRTPEDLEELSELFTHAFEPDEPETVGVMSGLRAVLDAWWESRGRELAVVLADGRARASLEQHLARMADQAPGSSTGTVAGSVHRGEVGFADLLAELDATTATAQQEPPAASLPPADHTPAPAAVGFWFEADGGHPRQLGTETSVPVDRAS